MVIKYHCSNGDRVSQQTINGRLSRQYNKSKDLSYTWCQGCKHNHAIEHDHTISQARCKVLHKTELIWDPENWSYSCRTCHGEWESYKSGTFEEHKNVIKRMLFVKEHDPEGFMKRYLCLSNYKVMKAVK